MLPPAVPIGTHRVPEFGRSIVVPRKPGAAVFRGARDESRDVLAQDAVENEHLGLSTLARAASPLFP